MTVDAGGLQRVEVGSLDLERFSEVLDADHLARLHAGMERARSVFGDRTVWNINSTARGGGVAEMLSPLISYARGAGVDARWSVIGGDGPFFKVTKRLHNRLHGSLGDGGELGDAEREVYEAALVPSAEQLTAALRPGDAVILHDPQTAGLVPVVKAAGVGVVWRCHIGADVVDDVIRSGWRFLLPYVEQADAVVFSRGAYAWEGIDPARIRLIAPTIDAFAPKNQELDEHAVHEILLASGLVAGRHDTGRPSFVRMDGSDGVVTARAQIIEDRPLRDDEPYVLQVSRWDALKDPLGVIDGFVAHVVPFAPDAHLVYAGPAVEAVSDDPEGKAVLDEARQRFEELEPSVRERVHLALLPMQDLEENAAIVNALQRRAAVVVQKSLAEGFGLTVSEAMWKSRPVVASRVGGIQDQLEDGRSGVLLDDPRDLEAYGAAVRGLLEDPDRAAELGANARERVRDHFLGSESLLAYLGVMAELLGAQR